MSPSRRRVLAALVATGGAGALSGTATGALLGDAERIDGRLTTGVVDVVVEYWRLSGPDSGTSVDPTDPDGVVDGPTLDVPIETLTADRPRGSTLFRIALPQDGDAVNNPASVWLRTECPAPTALAEFLQVRLAYADADGTPVATIAAGSLREVADELRRGVHLDADGDRTDGHRGCLVDELFVLVEYDLAGYVGAETTTLPLALAAVQCRNADPTASPFPPETVDEPCEVGYACDCCWAIGKVEVDDGFRPDATYAFDEGSADYALRVTSVDGDEGVAFELVSTDGDPVPPLCEVLVKGGPTDETYARLDDQFGSDTSALAGATDGLVYAPDNPNSGGRYGISHVLVGVCTPELEGDGCPADLARTSGGPPQHGGGRGGPKQ